MTGASRPWRAVLPRHRTRLLAGATLAILLLCWCGLRLYHDQHYRVQRLRLGMTRVEVESVMGRGPDCSARLGRATVLFFLDPAYHGPEACSAVAATYASPAELPTFYSALLVALDQQGSVSAFVHAGESDARTRISQRPGGTLSPLPLDALE
jgi:hypothetical protein